MPVLRKIQLNHGKQQLHLKFDDGANVVYDYEYLRVFSPRQQQQKGAARWPLHKKSVMITAVEFVAKHGYRLIFDDGFSDVYSADVLSALAHNYQQNWQHYTSELKKLGGTRDAKLDITQL